MRILSILLVLFLSVTVSAETPRQHAANLARSGAFYHSSAVRGSEGIGMGPTRRAAIRNCCPVRGVARVAAMRSAAGGWVAVKRGR